MLIRVDPVKIPEVYYDNETDEYVVSAYIHIRGLFNPKHLYLKGKLE